MSALVGPGHGDHLPRPVPLVGAFGVGGLVVVQSRINGALSSAMHSGLAAALISFGSGLLVLTVVLLVSPSMRRGLAAVREGLRSGVLRRRGLAYGVFGAYFVLVQSASVPVVGVAVFTVAVVAGQTASSLVVDRVGLGPAGRQPVSGRRVLAAGIAVLAVVVSVSDRWGGTAFSPVAVVAAALAGMGIAVQQALNGRVGVVSRQPFAATWINFVGGTTVLLAAAVASTLVAPGSLGGPLPPSWWLYTGGLIGILFIAGLAWAVPILGVLIAAVLSIAGQLTCALLLDLFLPAAGTTVSWHLLAGVLLTFLAAFLAAVRR